VRQVGYLQELYRDARWATEHETLNTLWAQFHLCVMWYIYILLKIFPPIHPPTKKKGGGLKCWCENNEIFTAHGLFFNKTLCEQTAPPRNVCGHHSVLPTDQLACFVNFTTFTQLSLTNFPHICRAADSEFGPRLKNKFVSGLHFSKGGLPRNIYITFQLMWKTRKNVPPALTVRWRATWACSG
jgi:hypothetical protein